MSDRAKPHQSSTWYIIAGMSEARALAVRNAVENDAGMYQLPAGTHSATAGKLFQEGLISLPCSPWLLTPRGIAVRAALLGEKT